MEKLTAQQLETEFNELKALIETFDFFLYAIMVGNMAIPSDDSQFYKIPQMAKQKLDRLFSLCCRILPEGNTDTNPQTVES